MGERKREVGGEREREGGSGAGRQTSTHTRTHTHSTMLARESVFMVLSSSSVLRNSSSRLSTYAESTHSPHSRSLTRSSLILIGLTD